MRHGFEPPSPEFRSTSTLIPILLLWAAALGLKDAYAFARAEILPQLKDISLNCWSADVGFDALVANPTELAAHGVGEGMMHVPEQAGEFLSTMTTVLAGVAPIEKAAWYTLRAAYIPLLSALHWRLQLPREMLGRQVIAVSDAGWCERHGQTAPG